MIQYLFPFYLLKSSWLIIHGLMPLIQKKKTMVLCRLGKWFLALIWTLPSNFYKELWVIASGVLLSYFYRLWLYQTVGKILASTTGTGRTPLYSPTFFNLQLCSLFSKRSLRINELFFSLKIMCISVNEFPIVLGAQKTSPSLNIRKQQIFALQNRSLSCSWVELAYFPKLEHS